MQMNLDRSLVGLTLFVAVVFLQVGIPATASAQGDAPMELTLPQAIDLALKQNKSLKMAQLAVVESEQKKKIARADYFPQISNQSTAFHVTEVQQLVIPVGSLGFGIPAQTAVIGQGTFTAYTSGTGLSQPLLPMFKTHQESRADTADINSAKIQVNRRKMISR